MINFLCSPLLGEMIQFDEHIFQMGGVGSTTNQITCGLNFFTLFSHRMSEAAGIVETATWANHSLRIHVWYIYLRLADFCGKCG